MPPKNHGLEAQREFLIIREGCMARCKLRGAPTFPTRLRSSHSCGWIGAVLLEPREAGLAENNSFCALRREIDETSKLHKEV